MLCRTPLIPALAFAIVLCLTPATAVPGASAKGRCVIEPFGYTGITIDSGSARRQMDEVSIDGKVVDVVDQYAPGREVPFKWERTGLSAGKRTIFIKLLEEKNPASKDRYINIARLEVP